MNRDTPCKKKLDLSKFISELRYNRRWTYTGSLTTAPFSEGILWNILEHVIPIRQSTLDMFLDYRNIEQSTVFNKFENEQQENEVAAKLSIQPDQMKPFQTEEGENFFRVAACNRVVQDQGDRPVYHIDIDPWTNKASMESHKYWKLLTLFIHAQPVILITLIIQHKISIAISFNSMPICPFSTVESIPFLYKYLRRHISIFWYLSLF